MPCSIFGAKGRNFFVPLLTHLANQLTPMSTIYTMTNDAQACKVTST